MNASALAPARSELTQIHGVEDFWARLTLRAFHPPASRMADQVLLDVLGLGIEQAATYLGRVQPDFAAFEAWVIATAGVPDPLRVARYNA